MTKFIKGLHQISNRCWAYLQPDGGWGLSNAGLISDGRSSILVDTLFDLRLTGEMLDAIGREPAAGPIEKLLITHANGDHVYGNQLLKGCRMIATKACAEEIAQTTPAFMQQMLDAAPELGDAGRYFSSAFSAFDFKDISLTVPGETFEGKTTCELGDMDIQLIQVGPCHTQGDMLVAVMSEKVVFAGDILFIGGTPIMWTGPVQNWIRACDVMLDMDAEQFIPGHGPVTDKNGVQSIRDYWVFLETETRKRFDDGMPFEKAVKDIDLGPFGQWREKERIAINVAALYKEFAKGDEPLNTLDLFGLMARMK